MCMFMTYKTDLTFAVPRVPPYLHRVRYALPVAEDLVQVLGAQDVSTPGVHSTIQDRNFL